MGQESCPAGFVHGRKRPVQQVLEENNLRRQLQRDSRHRSFHRLREGRQCLHAETLRQSLRQPDARNGLLGDISAVRNRLPGRIFTQDRNGKDIHSDLLRTSLRLSPGHNQDSGTDDFGIVPAPEGSRHFQGEPRECLPSRNHRFGHHLPS